MKKELLNRVAELGILFWVIKIFSTTVGETAADYIAVNLNFGLPTTTILMGVITIIVVIWNFRQKKYYPPAYWLLIVMMSIEGTLITDYLVDNLGVSLLILDVVFTIAMAVVFYLWYAKEETLSIHSINNNARERFYWIIVLTTFALGTGVGDTVSEYLNVGYLYSLVIFGSIFILAGILYYTKIISAVLAFWIAFIVTRPIGASLGDLFIQAPKDGGLGISITIINIIFFAVIIACVVYLTFNSHKKEKIVA
ncbi:uncharacterized membrane-anchored protein [Aequorivita sublithincola DSM 14238]|uniref:Uncharacterized membrane-anchored protein n=1 Tax=Aequorivita sublithincola (strain DSM 14238 / LMG 21431 / ACAM 643 / 9-3) TaxID=746697 RepID=I3Z056_AEQSU|nr:membrane protein [Aequorivita sublithincola]AFL82624.1 uncharacterized membrane-anchored protein [Aequorivita sublithincola DSM 14238]